MMIRIFLLVWIFGCFSSPLVWAQGGENPFDRKPVIEESKPDNAQNLPDRPDTDEAAIATPADNPFEMQRSPLTKEPDPVLNEADQIDTSSSSDPIPDRNFRFTIILVLLILIALLGSLYRTQLSKAFRSFNSDNFMKLVHREQGDGIQFSYLSLYIFFFLNAGLLLYLISTHFGQSYAHPARTFLMMSGGVAAFYTLKHLILTLLSNTFPLGKEIGQYGFMILIFSVILGVLLLPLNILIAFAPEGVARFIIYLSLVVAAGVYLFRSARAFFLGSKYVFLHKFHFFMYFCTVEIAPALVLIKLYLDQAGLSN